MHEKIKQLVKLLPPPPHPRFNKGNWDEVESMLGTHLPSDFKEFTEIYGACKLCNWIVIHTPFPLDKEYGNFLESLSTAYDGVTGGRDRIPYPQFPEPGGLLGIGGMDDGSIISWITDGENPDQWGIFFWQYPGISTFSFPTETLTDVLVQIIDRQSPIYSPDEGDFFFSKENRRVDVDPSIDPME